MKKSCSLIDLSYGNFQKLSVPDDRDCWFTSISFLLEKVRNGKNKAVLQQSLIILRNMDISNRNILLRQLVVEEWLGIHRLCMFSNQLWEIYIWRYAQKFLGGGMCHCELRNSGLLALANVLRLHQLSFHLCIESFPVILYIYYQGITLLPLYLGMWPSTSQETVTVILCFQKGRRYCMPRPNQGYCR